MNEKKLELVHTHRQSYTSILSSINQCLKEGDCAAQSIFVEKLLQLLSEGSIPQFLKEIDTVDMWGGSGAVWEVGFANKDLANRFETSMIELINLMEETDIVDRRMKSIRRLFLQNLENTE